MLPNASRVPLTKSAGVCSSGKCCVRNEAGFPEDAAGRRAAAIRQPGQVRMQQACWLVFRHKTSHPERSPGELLLHQADGALESLLITFGISRRWRPARLALAIRQVAPQNAQSASANASASASSSAVLEFPPAPCVSTRKSPRPVVGAVKCPAHRSFEVGKIGEGFCAHCFNQDPVGRTMLTHFHPHQTFYHRVQAGTEAEAENPIHLRRPPCTLW